MNGIVAHPVVYYAKTVDHDSILGLVLGLLDQDFKPQLIVVYVHGFFFSKRVNHNLNFKESKT